MVNIPPSLNKFLTSAPARFDLSSFSVLGIQGADAIAFAQAQFMNDVDLLDVMHWQWNGWLTTKGRVIALFLLLRVADDELLILLPDMPAAEFGRRLVAYVLRNRLQLGVWSELHVSGTFESSQTPAGIISGSWQDKSLELDLTVGDIGRSLHISTTQSDIHSEASAAWAMSSLIAGIPSLGPEQVEKWTPQQLGLQRLNAFSVKKGCYPGQEIVARTHFLGKNKRELIRVDNDAIDSIPAESVVCHSQLGDDRIALIVS